MCVRICVSTGGFDSFCPKSGISGSRKNGSNDFDETWYQLSLGVGLQFGGVAHPGKILVWPLGGPQKYQLLNRWTDLKKYQKIRTNYNKNKNFKKLP